MARDKKGKSEGKKAKIAEKKNKQVKKRIKKDKVKNVKDIDSDAEDVDLETILATYAKEQELFMKVTETICEPPKTRASASLIASPKNSNELFLFGGEYYDGAIATFYNDLYVYVINKDEWHSVTSPNTPLPRSGHAWCRGGNSKDIFMFGGEFSSPKQGTFYHYNDFWRFDPSTREWTRIDVKGKSPPARSGHRMTYHKNYIILFGGFHDTSQNTKYLADLWIYDTNTYTWSSPLLPPSTSKPDARSSFSFLPHIKGAVLFGGYSRVKVTVIGKQGKGKVVGNSTRNIYKPKIHQDCWFLRIDPPASDAASKSLSVFRWECRKKPTNLPNPTRAGATMTYHRSGGILFGGVHDMEENEERIESEFFNGLFVWNIDRNRLFQLTLRKPRPKMNKPDGGRSGRRGRGQANEEDLLKNLAILESKTSLINDENIDVSKESSAIDDVLPEKEILQEFPHVRFNAQLTVQDDILYIYGGTFEKGDREITFDDMYAIDLVKLNGVRQIFRREPENWQGSDIEEDIDADEDDEEDSDEDIDEDASDKESEKEMVNSIKINSKTNGTSQIENNSLLLVEDDEASSETRSKFDDISDEVINTNNIDENDNRFPQPRPFESRREFFQRTSADWQEITMTDLRWKGILPESLAIKEIKSKAFEMSEDHWWECREEILKLENEREAAGIGEVLTLAEKKEISGGWKKR